jgi:hypothetical protein
MVWQLVYIVLPTDIVPLFGAEWREAAIYAAGNVIEICSLATGTLPCTRRVKERGAMQLLSQVWLATARMSKSSTILGKGPAASMDVVNGVIGMIFGL